MKKKELSIPALTRLCTLYEVLGNFHEQGMKRVSSTTLGKALGVGAHNVRKDINFFGEIGSFGAGYDVLTLRRHIGSVLKLEKKRAACVVGLGRLGSAMLAYNGFTNKEYSMVAGFDSDVNLLDTIKTTIPVFPAYQITDIVRTKKIELGIIAVPAAAAKEVALRMIEGGIKGIVNFSQEVIFCDAIDVHITNIDMIKEFLVLSALMAKDEVETNNDK